MGGKKPRYLVDLLIEDETVPITFEPYERYKELRDFRKTLMSNALLKTE